MPNSWSGGGLSGFAEVGLPGVPYPEAFIVMGDFTLLAGSPDYQFAGRPDHEFGMPVTADLAVDAAARLAVTGADLVTWVDPGGLTTPAATNASNYVFASASLAGSLKRLWVDRKRPAPIICRSGSNWPDRSRPGSRIWASAPHPDCQPNAKGNSGQSDLSRGERRSQRRRQPLLPSGEKVAAKRPDEGDSICDRPTGQLIKMHPVPEAGPGLAIEPVAFDRHLAGDDRVQQCPGRHTGSRICG